MSVEYVENFINAVYPDTPEMAKTFLTEQKMLEDATNLIKELQAKAYIDGPPPHDCQEALLARDGYFAAHGQRIHNHDEAQWAIAGDFVSDEEVVAHFPLDALINAGER